VYELSPVKAAGRPNKSLSAAVAAAAAAVEDEDGDGDGGGDGGGDGDGDGGAEEDEKSNMRRVHVVLQMKRNDRLMNRHMPLTATTWRANSDLTIIYDPQTMLWYLTKYVTKNEKPDAITDRVLEMIDTVRDPLWPCCCSAPIVHRLCR
jgi:hypothetical protein